MADEEHFFIQFQCQRPIGLRLRDSAPFAQRNTQIALPLRVGGIAQRQSPDATTEDFTTAAYAAATEPPLAATAKDILNRMEAKFPEEEGAHRLAGWCHINLEDFAAALQSFEAAEKTLKSDEEPGTDLLAGLSLARWLNKQTDAAIATYKQLIEAGRAEEKPGDWAAVKTITDLGWPKAETTPLEALRKATLKKHPDLISPRELEPKKADEN